MCNRATRAQEQKKYVFTYVCEMVVLLPRRSYGVGESKYTIVGVQPSNTNTRTKENARGEIKATTLLDYSGTLLGFNGKFQAQLFLKSIFHSLLYFPNKLHLN